MILLLLLNAGRFLTISQTPQHADVIIVLSGGTGRVEKAVELFEDGYVTYMILSKAQETASESVDMLQTAISLGIPREAIILENAAASTLQNAEYTFSIMKKKGFSSAIVVSSDFHMRRTKFLFEPAYNKSGIELKYIGSYSGYNIKYWWSSQYSRQKTFNEYVKIVGNTFGYTCQKQKIH